MPGWVGGLGIGVTIPQSFKRLLATWLSAQTLMICQG